LPEIPARAAATGRVFRAALIREGDGIWMRQRPEGVVNAGFWEMPNWEANDESPRETFASGLGSKPLKMRRLCDVKHTIMNHRITTEVFAVNGSNGVSGKLFAINDLKAIPLVSAHRKGLMKAGYLKSLT
jgi:adenine-specific DNA glycosylase